MNTYLHHGLHIERHVTLYRIVHDSINWIRLRFNLEGYLKKMVALLASAFLGYLIKWTIRRFDADKRIQNVTMANQTYSWYYETRETIEFEMVPRLDKILFMAGEVGLSRSFMDAVNGLRSRLTEFHKRLDRTLSCLDEEPTNSEFRSLSQDELWESRSKAYDYVM